MMSVVASLSQSAIFEPLWPSLGLFADLDQLPGPGQLNERLRVESIRFVPQGAKSSEFEDGYEPRIYLQGEVQTREESWHDFFNALVWHEFPQAKKMINKLQYELLRQRYTPRVLTDTNNIEAVIGSEIDHKQHCSFRTPAENMLTLFDENGVIVLSSNPLLLELIKSHRWHELFWERREEFKAHAKVIIFGHGLYEKAINPYIGITAQALLIENQNITNLDTFLVEFFSVKANTLATSDLYPLPILGIPGWWPDNEFESFYANEKYFRPLVKSK